MWPKEQRQLAATCKRAGSFARKSWQLQIKQLAVVRETAGNYLP
jgi:hypothetical protein